MVFVGRLLEILISFDNLADVKIEDKNDLMKINDPLIFVKNAIDWDAFTLICSLYHLDTYKSDDILLMVYKDGRSVHSQKRTVKRLLDTRVIQ